MRMVLDLNSVKDYQTFIKAKGLPRFKCVGHTIEFPDEYASMLGIQIPVPATRKKYVPIKGLFDYQAAVAKVCAKKKKYCVFAQCGIGKDLMMKEMVRHCANVLPKEKKILVMEPLNCINQSLEEAQKWYGNKLKLERVKSSNLNDWLLGSGGRVGVCNFDGLDNETPQGRLGALLVNESSVMKNSGVWTGALLRMGDGLEYKYAYTGTPAPNDRIEYANHAVFMDVFPTVNSFYARYFVNKGDTSERWILKPHALGRFYREISHWCIFLENPGTYGFKDNIDSIPPIHVHIHDVELTEEQSDAVYSLTGKLFVDQAGGITKRAKLSQIAKGNYNGSKIDTKKSKFIVDLVSSWSSSESTIIWCEHNNEQDEMERLFPNAASIRGSTKYENRAKMLRDFQEGKTREIISKPECLGYGLNLQIATRQVFSGISDSYEDFWQAVKRSNRVGSKLPLNVHIPTTEIERPRVANVLRKAKRVHEDSLEQEKVFKERGVILWD